MARPLALNHAKCEILEQNLLGNRVGELGAAGAGGYGREWDPGTVGTWVSGYRVWRNLNYVPGGKKNYASGT